MLSLRKNRNDPELLDILSDRIATATLVLVAEGRTELEVRRFFRDRAIAQARQAVESLLRDLPQ